MTRLSAAASVGEGEASVPAYVQALLEQTADGLERMQRAIVDSERERRARRADGRAQRPTSRAWPNPGRTARRAEALGQGGSTLSDELRAEFRLLGARSRRRWSEARRGTP
jgi:hypothetical protein